MEGRTILQARLDAMVSSVAGLTGNGHEEPLPMDASVSTAVADLRASVARLLKSTELDCDKDAPCPVMAGGDGMPAPADRGVSMDARFRP